MLLTFVTPPPDDRADFKFTHEASPRPRTSSTRPPSHVYDQPYPLQQGRTSRNADMSTHHRGLPPPAAMALPDPRRPSIPPSLSGDFGRLQSGPGPGQYPSHDEQSRDLHIQARMEDDRKRQEEQKTRQEELRLEQRKIEHNMLRESFQGGVPPHLVPMIFAGLGGGNLASAALDMAQQYLASFQQAIPPQHAVAPQDRSRDPNCIAQPAYVSSQHAAAAAGQSAPGSSLPPTAVYPSPAYGSSPPNHAKGFVHTPRQSTQVVGGSLPKLTTNEAHVQGAIVNYAPAPSTQSTSQDVTSQSPNIFFHHWQPPNTQSNQSSGKDGQKTTPNSSGNLSSTGDSSSPRKRKAQGPHEPAPVPSSAPKTTSPALSANSSTSPRRTGHSKGESAGSNRAAEPVAPTPLRENSTQSSHEESKTPKQTPPERYASAEPYRPPSGSSKVDP